MWGMTGTATLGCNCIVGSRNAHNAGCLASSSGMRQKKTCVWLKTMSMPSHRRLTPSLFSTINPQHAACVHSAAPRKTALPLFCFFKTNKPWRNSASTLHDFPGQHTNSWRGQYKCSSVSHRESWPGAVQKCSDCRRTWNSGQLCCPLLGQGSLQSFVNMGEWSYVHAFWGMYEWDCNTWYGVTHSMPADHGKGTSAFNFAFLRTFWTNFAGFGDVLQKDKYP